MCLCVYPSKRIHVTVSVVRSESKFGTHMQIHLEKVVGKLKICPVSCRGEFGGFRGSEIENVWKSAKWLDRLAPNLAHMCGFIENGHRLKTISSSRPKGGTWGFRGSKCKSQENLPSGCTDWHQFCYTSVDSCGSGHRLKTITPLTQETFWGGFRVSQNAKVWKIYQTAGPIGTKFGTRLRINLGMGVG